MVSPFPIYGTTNTGWGGSQEVARVWSRRRLKAVSAQLSAFSFLFLLIADSAICGGSTTLRKSLQRWAVIRLMASWRVRSSLA